MWAYYNEFSAFPAQWLRSLSAAGHITNGTIDERSIEEVSADDVRTAVRAHFFAGIGGWDVALRLAGWPDDAPVWTGSCPCQPFSVAGKRLGTHDERHLWPEWHRLIRQCMPPVVFGEQVASPDGRDWLASVRTDLEALGYAVGAADLCAAGVGAPHTRQRLWFGAVRMAYADVQRREGLGLHVRQRGQVEGVPQTARRGAGGVRMGNPVGTGLAGRQGVAGHHEQEQPAAQRAGRHAGWSDVAWLDGTDGFVRPTEPGLLPVADGVPERMGRLHAYGNAIVPQVAATFIRAFVESAGDMWGAP